MEADNKPYNENVRAFIDALIKARETALSSAVSHFPINDHEIAFYLTKSRRESPGVIVLNMNGTWRYDSELPAGDWLNKPPNKPREV